LNFVIAASTAMPPIATATKVATTIGSCSGRASIVNRPKIGLIARAGVDIIKTVSQE